MIKKLATLILAFSMTLIFSATAFAGSGFGPGMIRHFDGEEIMILKNSTESQMNSYVITTKNGGVIVVDGGTEADADHLAEVIRSKGGVVHAWFITHPHSDHAGAFTRMATEGFEKWNIQLVSVFANIADQSWYDTAEPSRAEYVKTIRAALESTGVRYATVHRGSVMDLDGVIVTVMNDPYLVDNNSINNSSVVYRMQIGDKTVTFLGDMGWDVGEMFLRDHAGEDLSTYFVQMAHHGQAGVGREFYAALAPKACMWNSPAWLYENYSGNYKTTEVRQWMKELGVTENYSIADGDQIIR